MPSYYTQYYLEARDASDKISEKTYKGPPKTDLESFMPRKQKEQPSSDPHRLVLDYMSSVRNTFQSEETLPTANAPKSSPRPPAKDIRTAPAGGDTMTALEALSSIESSDNYEALGPIMQKGMYKGDRAYGRYQVMGKNIPSWTKEILGREYTPEEFLKDTNAQDLVAAHRMNQSFEKYGTWEDAASVWFSGRPLDKAGEASDGYMTTPAYVRKFSREMKKRNDQRV